MTPIYILICVHYGRIYDEVFPKQECIPEGCVPPTLYRVGGLCPGEFLSGRGSLSIQGVSGSLSRGWGSVRETHLEHETRDGDPPEGTWDQAARQEVISYREPFPNCGHND